MPSDSFLKDMKYFEQYINKVVLRSFFVKYSGDPILGRLTKRTIPEYGPPLASPKFVPIHIMYCQIQKADRPAIRDTDHAFSVPNYKRTKKTDHPQEQKNSHF